MVGFPGETEEDFEDTMDLVDKAGYDQVFTFIYFKKNRYSCGKDGSVAEDVIKERFDRLLKLVNCTRLKKGQELQGSNSSGSC